jgi:hypothetical protein
VRHSDSHRTLGRQSRAAPLKIRTSIGNHFSAWANRHCRSAAFEVTGPPFAAVVRKRTPYHKAERSAAGYRWRNCRARRSPCHVYRRPAGRHAGHRPANAVVAIVLRSKSMRSSLPPANERGWLGTPTVKGIPQKPGPGSMLIHSRDYRGGGAHPRHTGSHRTCMGLFLSSGCFGFC